MIGADWAGLRILIHAGSAAAVLRIGRSLGLSMAGGTFAALVFAASPIAFTALYLASGIQELLGGLFALLACERWLLRPGAGNVLAALGLAILSILSKETGFGLPILFSLSLLPHPALEHNREDTG